LRTTSARRLDVVRRLSKPGQDGGVAIVAREAIREVCVSVSKPVNVVMGLKGATYSVEELAAAGVRRISVGGAFARAAIGAFVRAAREVKDKGAFTFAVDAISHAEVRGYMANVKR
jgi:2-methylisocitrate lyase-like PEP mutase family enzyme